MNQQLENKYKSRIINYRQYLFILGCICLSLLGSTFNYLAIVSNDNKMPVYTNINVSEFSKYHFNYVDTHIPFSFLADNIYLKNAWWSIGDLFMIFRVRTTREWLVRLSNR